MYRKYVKWTSFIVIKYKYRVYQSADLCVAKYLMDISQPCKAWFQAHCGQRKDFPWFHWALIVPLSVFFHEMEKIITCGIVWYDWGKKMSLVMLDLCKSGQNLTLYTGMSEKE